ncbi:membrane integrity-associated transporter subunit PqiC [bacterium SPL81]|nr:membrane integrity-associated transporter subunit PqiC [Acinetobacter baumannii]
MINKSIKKSFFNENVNVNTGLVLMTLMLSACSSSTTPNYYTLAPKVTPIVSSNVRVIEVLPVGLPDRLNRAPLVIQNNNGQSKVLDNERWTSTLSAELRDGLSAGLQQKLGAVDRYSSGMTGGKVSYRIATDFSRFDIINNLASDKSNRAVEISVAWIIKREDPFKVLSTKTNPNTTNTIHQLSCRMSFTQPILNDLNKTQDVVNASSIGLSRVIDAVAASVNMVDEKRIMTINGVTCS